MIGILANQKGGVAKTTNTLHLAAALAYKGYSVLIIDLDGQSDISHGAGIKNNSYNIIDFLEDKDGFRLKSTLKNLFLLAGSDEFISNNYPLNALKNALNKKRLHSDGTKKSINESFDFIFIDCPPSKIINFGTKKYDTSEIELALYCVDFFLIPLKTEDYSVKNANKFLCKIGMFVTKNKLELTFLGFFFGAVLVTSNSYDYYVNLLKKHTKGLLFKNYIRQDTEVGNAVREGKTIFQYKPNCRAANDYIAFCDEFLTKL